MQKNKNVLTKYAKAYIVELQVIQMHRKEVIAVVYSNLKAEMSRKNISNEDVSRLLGVHRNSVYNKLNCESSFSIEEAILIHKTFFPTLDMKYLFTTDNT